MQSPVLIEPERFETAVTLYTEAFGGVVERGPGQCRFGNGLRLAAFLDGLDPGGAAVCHVADTLQTASALFDPAQVCLFRDGPGWPPRALVEADGRWALHLQDRVGISWVLTDDTRAIGPRLDALRAWLSAGCGALRRLVVAAHGDWRAAADAPLQVAVSATRWGAQTGLGPPHFEHLDPFGLGGPRQTWAFEAADGTRLVVEQVQEPAQVRLFMDPPDLDRAWPLLGVGQNRWRVDPKANVEADGFELWRQDKTGSRACVRTHLSAYLAARWRTVLEAQGHDWLYWIEPSRAAADTRGDPDTQGPSAVSG